jgi:hypothetical protein
LHRIIYMLNIFKSSLINWTSDIEQEINNYKNTFIQYTDLNSILRNILEFHKKHYVVNNKLVTLASAPVNYAWNFFWLVSQDLLRSA